MPRPPKLSLAAIVASATPPGKALPKPGRPARAASSGDTTPARKGAPKYRDPETGETWSGRGLKPKGLSHAIENGRTLEEFTIAQ